MTVRDSRTIADTHDTKGGLPFQADVRVDRLTDVIAREPPKPDAIERRPE
jgi:hypothetical protein